MSKQRIERELGKSLLEKKLFAMSKNKRDEYFDEVKKGIDSQHPFRNHPLISNLYNEDGLYLTKNYGNAEWAEMSRRVNSLDNKYSKDKKVKHLNKIDDKIKNLQNELKINRETRQMGGLLEDDREQYAGGTIVKKLIAEYNKRKKIVSEEYDPAFAKTEELTREVTPAEAKKLLDVIGKQGGAENTLPYQLGGIEGTIDRVFESELAMVAGGNKPQRLKSFWIARDASADDDFMVSNMPLNKIIDDIVGRKDIDPRKPMTQKEIDSELEMMTERGDFVDGGLLQDDRQKIRKP